MTSVVCNGRKLKPYCFMEYDTDGNEDVPMDEISEMATGLEGAEEGVNSEGHSEAFSTP